MLQPHCRESSTLTRHTSSPVRLIERHQVVVRGAEKDAAAAHGDAAILLSV